MKAFFFALLAIFLGVAKVSAQKQLPVYEIRTYILDNDSQEHTVEEYVKQSLLPGLKRNGIKDIGVFKPVDRSSAKRLVLFIPYKDLRQFGNIENLLSRDKVYQKSAQSYLSTPYNKPAFSRVKTVLLKSFTGMPFYKKPALTSDRSARVYELRSYEGPTEDLYARKVDMFNRGGEISLFNRLGFNAVFYGSVIAGDRMPNLMYMTSFEDMASRDEHWKTFSADPEWKKLAAMEYYKNTVSKSEKHLLFPTSYSDF